MDNISPIAPTPPVVPTGDSKSSTLVPYAVAIALVVGWGVFSTAPVSLLFIVALFSPYVLALLPAVVVAALCIGISLWASQMVYKREGIPLQAFFFATALYILLAIGALALTSFGLTHFSRAVADDVSFLVGLLFSTLFTSSVLVLYIGLVVCMILLIRGFRSVPTGAIVLPSTFSIWSRYSVIAFAVLMLMYVFGVAGIVARVVHVQSLCALVYSSSAKANCFLNTSPTEVSNDTAASGTFTIAKSDYKAIKDLHDIGGKLAYAFENKDDKTSGVVYDGQVMSGAYQKVGILPIAEVGGTLAYEAYKGAKQIIVWNGQEYGEQYDMALHPTDVGGKLAYLARTGTGDNIRQVVVWDGKEYGTDLNNALDITDIGGELAYSGKNAYGSYIVVGNKRYGPYSWVQWLQENDGHAVAKVTTMQNINTYVVDGVVINSPYKDSTGTYTFVDGKFAYSAVKEDRKHFAIIYDGREVGTTASSEAGPYTIQGKLAYVAANADGTSQLIVGGQPVGPVISGTAHNIDVSKGGKVAIQVDDGTKQCRGTVHGPVYIDGKEIYNGCSSNPFGFFDEKLLFWISKNGLSTLWYDGAEIGQGFYGFNYFAVVHGKLIIAAFASANQGVEYSLLVEQ